MQLALLMSFRLLSEGNTLPTHHTVTQVLFWCVRQQLPGLVKKALACSSLVALQTMPRAAARLHLGSFGFFWASGGAAGSCQWICQGSSLAAQWPWELLISCVSILYKVLSPTESLCSNHSHLPNDLAMTWNCFTWKRRGMVYCDILPPLELGKWGGRKSAGRATAAGAALMDIGRRGRGQHITWTTGQHPCPWQEVGTR